MPPLANSKHEAFVLGILEGKSGRQAYLEAGYKCSNAAADASASDLLQNPKVARRLQELKQEAAKAAVVTRAWVLERLKRNADIALGDEKIAVTKAVKSRIKDEAGGFTEAVATVQVEVTERDAAAANRALELLGREAEEGPLFVERKEIGEPGAFEDLTDEDLLERIHDITGESARSLPVRRRARAARNPKTLQ